MKILLYVLENFLSDLADAKIDGSYEIKNGISLFF